MVVVVDTVAGAVSVVVEDTIEEVRDLAEVAMGMVVVVAADSEEEAEEAVAAAGNEVERRPELEAFRIALLLLVDRIGDSPMNMLTLGPAR